MHESLATKLRVLRAERGLTVRQVAELSGVAKETISQIERGERHPYDRTLAKLAHAYDVPVEELLEEPVAIAERSLAGSPKGEAPETGPASPEASPLLEDPRVQDWLEDQDAALLLMSDQDFVDHVAEVHELEDLETLAGELASEKDRVLTSLNNPDVEKTLFPTHVETFSAKEERLHEAMRPARGTFYLRSEIRGEYLRRELAVSNYIRHLYASRGLEEARRYLREELVGA